MDTVIRFRLQSNTARGMDVWWYGCIGVRLQQHCLALAFERGFTYLDIQKHAIEMNLDFDPSTSTCTRTGFLYQVHGKVNVGTIRKITVFYPQ